MKAWKSDVNYMKHLVEAVWEGVASAPEETATPALASVMRPAVWTPAAIGAAVGVLSANWSTRHRSGYRMAVGGLVGSTLGLGAGVVWEARGYTAAVVRSTVRKVNRVRDARWLEKHPIAYA